MPRQILYLVMLTTVVTVDPIYVTFTGDERAYLRYQDLARTGNRQSSRDAPNPVLVGLANEEGYPHKGEMDFETTRSIRPPARFAPARCCRNIARAQRPHEAQQRDRASAIEGQRIAALARSRDVIIEE